MKNMIRVRKHYRRAFRYTATNKDKVMRLNGQIQGALYVGNWDDALEYAREIEQLSPERVGYVDMIRKSRPTHATIAHTTPSTTVKPAHVGFVSVLIVLCFILGL